MSHSATTLIATLLMSISAHTQAATVPPPSIGLGLQTALDEAQKAAKTQQAKAEENKDWWRPLEAQRQAMRHLRKKVTAATLPMEIKGPNGEGVGTGFFIDSSGLMMTASHLFDNGYEITLPNGLTAKILARAPERDVAILQVEGIEGKVPFLEFAEDNDTELMDPIFSFGDSNWTREGRTDRVLIPRQGIVQVCKTETESPYATCTQTDLDNFQGDSGGPQVNIRGQVVAMTRSGALRQMMGNPFKQKQNFGTHLDVIKGAAEEFKKTGTLADPGFNDYFDKVVSYVTDDKGQMERDERGFPKVQVEVYVRHPADGSVFQRGDQILSIEGQAVGDEPRPIHDLKGLMSQKAVGDKIKIKISRIFELEEKDPDGQAQYERREIEIEAPLEAMERRLTPNVRDLRQRQRGFGHPGFMIIPGHQ